MEKEIFFDGYYPKEGKLLGPPALWYDIGLPVRRCDYACKECLERIEAIGLTSRDFWHKYFQPLWDVVYTGKVSIK